jgi:hypothetical protein
LYTITGCDTKASSGGKPLAFAAMAPTASRRVIRMFLAFIVAIVLRV